VKDMKIIDNIFGDSLLKNSIYLMTTSVTSSIFAFIFWIVAARYYTSDDIGIGSAIFSSISLISIIGSIGLPTALVFYLPRNKNTNKIISSCLVIGIMSPIIFSLIFILGLKIWAPDLMLILNNLKNISIFILIAVSISISALIGAALTAGKRSFFQLIKEVIYNFIKIFPLVLFTSFGTMGIIISICIGLLLSMIIGFILLFKVWKYSPKLILDPIIIEMAGFSTGNYIANIFYNLPMLILPIMILNMVSAKSAGYFYIAMMMAGLLYGISHAISSSFLVESSNKDKFSGDINKSIKFNLVILIPGLLMFIIFGNLILNIFNHDYAENATTTLIILAVTSIPVSAVNIFSAIRNSQKRVLSIIKIDMFVALTTIILSLYFIRIMNIEGAAISYLIANTVGALIIASRVKNPKESTMRLLNDIKKNVSHNF
jgi:O-antigen/teichoic acid export membrane protein